MSNTDGEDTLRIEKEAIAFADSIEVNSIATHTGLVKGYIAGAKELASLREQKKKDDEEFNRALETIKELEKMYANTHGKLRDLEKEHSDNKANLHRAYKGLERLNELKEQLKQRDKELERLNNDLLDALDLKNGNGPTALSMLSEKLKIEKENNANAVKFIGDLNAQLKQKEDENRDLKDKIKCALVLIASKPDEDVKMAYDVLDKTRQ